MNRHLPNVLDTREDNTYAELAGRLILIRRFEVRLGTYAKAILRTRTGMAHLEIPPPAYAKYRDGISEDLAVDVAGRVDHRAGRGVLVVMRLAVLPGEGGTNA